MQVGADPLQILTLTLIHFQKVKSALQDLALLDFGLVSGPGNLTYVD